MLIRKCVCFFPYLSLPLLEHNVLGCPQREAFETESHREVHETLASLQEQQKEVKRKQKEVKRKEDLPQGHCEDAGML